MTTRCCPAREAPLVIGWADDGRRHRSRRPAYPEVPVDFRSTSTVRRTRVSCLSREVRRCTRRRADGLPLTLHIANVRSGAPPVRAGPQGPASPRRLSRVSG